MALLPVPVPGDIAAVSVILGDSGNHTYPIYRPGTPPDAYATVMTVVFEVLRNEHVRTSPQGTRRPVPLGALTPLPGHSNLPSPGCSNPHPRVL